MCGRSLRFLSSPSQLGAAGGAGLVEHSGNWYYKHTNTSATCEGPVSGTTKALTGLTDGTSYTYSAYSDSTCTTGNLLATASSFTTLHSPPGAPTNLSVNKNTWRADWDAPANKGSGGSSLTYTLECKRGNGGWMTEVSGDEQHLRGVPQPALVQAT